MYYYRGRRYQSKPPLKTRMKATLKEYASRVWESIQGEHPGGAEALVERMIKEFPGKPTQQAEPQPDPQPTSPKEP